MELAAVIFGALIIDWLAGDPRSRLHPVVLIGKAALKLELFVRRRTANPFLGGMICTVAVTVFSAAAAYVPVKLCLRVNYIAGVAAAALMVFITIALKSLLRHAAAIEEPLKAGDIDTARNKAAMIVSRDTAILDEAGIIRSCLESLGENVVDGVTAAMFYTALGWYLDGPAGAAAGAWFYRAANTLDATFGYKNQRYEKFGTFPARLDDVLNYLPARLTLAAVYPAAVLGGLRAGNAVRCAWRDRKKHPSPNSAWGMAAFAGALGVQLGGPVRYDGIWEQYPRWGIKYEELEIKHVGLAEKLAVLTTIMFGLLLTAAGCLL
ncbi:MAG: adenosylcobinamide-phosphate synthase CbiB [Victivallaceae bacterium]|nr:adenosylcobinamide-phosphate synthase CbiB [Victivallaceae bacterium]